MPIKYYTTRSFLLKFKLIHLLLLLCVYQSGNSQENWSLSLRSGPSLSKRPFGSIHLKNGIGIQGTIFYKLKSNLSLYSGLEWNKFGSDKLYLNKQMVLQETGINAGVRYTEYIGKSNLKYLFGGGILYNHVQFEHSENDIRQDKTFVLGWSAEAGIVLPCGKHFSLSPTARYHSLRTNFTQGGATAVTELYYASIYMELIYHFSEQYNRKDTMKQ